jgi:hypothetical protein
MTPASGANEKEGRCEMNLFDYLFAWLGRSSQDCDRSDRYCDRDKDGYDDWDRDRDGRRDY